MKAKISFEIDTELSEEEVKAKFCYTDRVHRKINDEIVEIDNPVSFIEYLTGEAKGHIENKINRVNKGFCC